MNINVEIAGGVTVIALSGALDSASAPKLQETVLPLIEPDCRIMIDMSGVDYLSSAGLRSLLTMYRRIAESDGRVVLVGLADRVKDVMDITGFLHFFTVCDDRTSGFQTLA
jgi:anti-sigma B factor antagonist